MEVTSYTIINFYIYIHAHRWACVCVYEREQCIEVKVKHFMNKMMVLKSAVQFEFIIKVEQDISIIHRMYLTFK